MLGKTNITTLSEGAIVTEIEDYRWIQLQSGIYSNFVKTIYQNGYLVAITMDGSIVYTTDGEVWNVLTLEYAECRLNDIEWDGRRFLLVGCYVKEDSNNETTGLIVATTNFEAMETITLPEYAYKEYYLISSKNGKYVLVAKYDSYLCVVTSSSMSDIIGHEQLYNYTASTPGVQDCVAVKNSSGILVYYRLFQPAKYSSPDISSHFIKRIIDEGIISLRDYSEDFKYNHSKVFTLFECKDILYFLGLLAKNNYSLNEVTNAGEIMVMNTGQNFMFKDGVYFNDCEVFINSHEMLVVKKGERIAEKTLNDLIEIEPELTMNCITKAFGQLFIFGNQGVILKSSVETNNENAIAVQTLSAKKALYDAKQYTDDRYAALEARIAALEG